MRISQYSKPMTVVSAIQNKLTPFGWEYDNKIAQLELKLQLQSDMIAVLIELLTTTHLILKKEDMKAILGSTYDILED